MPDWMFSEGELSSALQSNERRMRNEIDNLGEDHLLNTRQEELSEYFLQKYRVELLRIDESQIQMEYEDVQIDVSQRFGYFAYHTGRTTYVTGTRIIFHVPFSGDKALFRLRPSTFSFELPYMTVTDSEMILVYDMTPAEMEADPNEIRGNFDSQLAKLKQWLEWIESDVAPFNAALPSKVSHAISSRREKILKDKNLAETIGFPLRRKPGLTETYVAPQVKRILRPALPPPISPYKPEPILEAEEYEYILTILNSMAVTMERNPKVFSGMDEESLRHFFLAVLNSHYEGQATGETFNYEGKTDILVRVEGKNIFVAECKFWKGQESLTGAIDQLLSYATWRDTKTAILVFNREVRMSTVLPKIPAIVTGHANFVREIPCESETGFRYVLRHRDDPDRELTLTVLVFDVPA